MKKKILLSLSIIALAACESNTYDEVTKDEDVKPDEKVTYNNNVKRIIEAKCVSCHTPNSTASSYPLTNYNQVKNSIDKIIDRIGRPAGDPLRMPQGGSMSAADINLIKKWKTDGLLQD